MVTLPAEIWLMILSPMERRDIFNLALASRTLSGAARRTLAQNVTLNGQDGRGHQEYVAHLRNHDLLRLIKKLEIKMMPLDAVPWSEMPNLLSLSFGPIRADQSQCPHDWTKRLYAYVAHVGAFKLEEIVVESENPMPEGKLAIPNIKRIIWNDAGGLSLSFFSLCQASVHTITELTVVVTDDPSETDTYVKLWKLRIPNLRLLSIGPGNAAFLVLSYPAVEEAFAQFLHAHPAVDNLTLRSLYDPDFVDDGDVYLPLDPSTITRTAGTILPNLTSLHAHPKQIQTFVNADARFLRTLKTLAVPEEPYGAVWRTMTNLLESFELYNQRNGTPSGIRHVSFFLFDASYECALSFRKFKAIILRASKVYPELEIWEGTVPSVNVLKECFPKFRRLKELHCMSEYEPANVDNVRKLAEQCPSLETYRCIKSGREFEITREGAEGQVRVRVLTESEEQSAGNGLKEGENRDEDEEEDEDEGGDGDEDEEFSDDEF